MVGDRGFCSTTSWATWCCNQNCWQLLSFCPENSQTKQPSKRGSIAHKTPTCTVLKTQSALSFNTSSPESHYATPVDSTCSSCVACCVVVLQLRASQQAGMSQNPFEPGQTERTPEEQAAFLSAIAALPEARVRRIGCLLTWCASMCPGSGTLGQVHFMCCRIQNTTFTQKIWRCSSQVLQAL